MAADRCLNGPEERQRQSARREAAEKAAQEVKRRFAK